MSPARKTKKAAKKSSRPARPAAGKAKPAAAKAKPAKAAKAKKGAKAEKRHCAATDPFGDPCQSVPRMGSTYCTIHSYLDR